MMDELQAIVISTVKYGDYSLICRCYTKTFGLRSFLLRNRSVKGPGKASFFIPLSQVFITPFFQKSTALATIKEVRSAHFYKSLQRHPSKIALAIFLSEFLGIVLKEDQPDPDLFAYLTNSFKKLDEKENYFADFYLLFIMGLTKFLGFYPNVDHLDKVYFDLQNGVFISECFDLKTYLSKEDSSLLKRLIALDFSEIPPRGCFEKRQRRALLNILLTYYQLQHEGFRTPRSLEILSEIS